MACGTWHKPRGLGNVVLTGVSVAADSTGTHSLYTTYQDYEIMFHVSTLLPYTPNNRQQVSGAQGRSPHMIFSGYTAEPQVTLPLWGWKLAAWRALALLPLWGPMALETLYTMVMSLGGWRLDQVSFDTSVFLAVPRPPCLHLETQLSSLLHHQGCCEKQDCISQHYFDQK